MKQVETIDKVIELEKRKLRLMEEFREALLIESADFVVDQVKMSRGLRDDFDYWFLVHKDSKEIKFEGNAAQVQKFLDKRGITKVYWRKLKH